MKLNVAQSALVLALATILALVGVATVLPSSAADATPSRCTVEVLIHEDDSYSKLALRYDGVKISHAWNVTPPRQQNTVTLRRTHTGALERVANVDWSAAGPVFRGSPCTVVPVRSTR